MTSKTKFSWKNISVENQRLLLDIIGYDGHTIWSSQQLLEKGVDAAVVVKFTDKYESDRSSVKSTIFVNNVPVSELDGVYGLTVLWSLADYYNVSSDKNGRGFQAQELTTKILEKLNAGV